MSEGEDKYEIYQKKVVIHWRRQRLLVLSFWFLSRVIIDISQLKLVLVFLFEIYSLKIISNQIDGTAAREASTIDLALR